MNHKDQNITDKSMPSWREPLAWMRERVKIKAWHLILGSLLSALFLWLAFRDVSLVEVNDYLSDLDWRFVILALAINIGGTLVRAARWRLLYYPEHHERQFLHLSGVLFISQMLNVLIPVRVGELARIALMRPLSMVRTLGSIAVEKLLDMLTLLAFLLILPLALSLPGWFRQSSQSFVLLVLLLLGLSLVLFFSKEKLLSWFSSLLRFLPEKWQDHLRGTIQKALTSLDVFRDPRIGLRLQLWSILVWGIGVLGNYVLFLAFDFSLPLSAALFLLLVLQVGISVPSIPGKLGVFQYLVILALIPFGVEKDQALAYSLILYLVGFGPHIVFGALFGMREWATFRRRAPEVEMVSKEGGSSNLETDL